HRPECSRPWAGCAGVTRARRCRRARDDAGLRRRLRACATDEGGRADAARSPPRRRARPPRLVREGRVESLAIPRQLALEIERARRNTGPPCPFFLGCSRWLSGGFAPTVRRQSRGQGAAGAVWSRRPPRPPHAAGVPAV